MSKPGSAGGNVGVLLASVVALLLSWTTSGAPAPAEPYWFTSTSKAIEARNIHLKRLGIGLQPGRYAVPRSGGAAALLSDVNEEIGTASGAWYHFIKGAVGPAGTPEAGDNHYAKALSAAARNPGLLWVLSTEFRELGRPDWTTRCLEEIERLALEVGAPSLPVFGHQLLALSSTSEERDARLDQLAWARRLDAPGFWPTLASAWHMLFADPFGSFSAIGESARILASSWRVQLEFAYLLHRWLRTALIALVAAVVIACGIKGLPSAMHTIAELYPVGLPPWSRHACAIVAFLSISAFGLIPFLVVTSVAIWGHLERRLRIPLTAAVAVLAVAPLDSRIEDALIGALETSGEIALYGRAVDEGHRTSLASLAVDCARRNPEHPLAQTTAALLYYKDGDLGAAWDFAGRALELDDSDPMVRITAGNTAFGLGKYDTARVLFERAADLHPEYEQAIFNLGQTHVASLEALAGTDLHERAREVAGRQRLPVNPVSAFLEKNDRYFGERSPRLRRTMIGDYKPATFWRKVLPAAIDSWEGADRLWAPSFFGFGARVSALLIVAFGLVGFGLQARNLSGKRVRTIFYCVSCGMPMCRKCKAGRVCVSCHNATEGVTNPAIRKRIEGRIHDRTHVQWQWTCGVADVLFPGIALLLDETEHVWKALLVLGATSSMYATYGLLATGAGSQPSGPFRGLVSATAVALAILNLVLVARAVLRAKSQSVPKGMVQWR